MESMNDFDKIIKDKIGSIEEMPPAHLWANISKEIAVPQAAAIPFYKSSKFIISAAVASIVVVMGAMWFFAKSNTVDNKGNITLNTENVKVENTDIEDSIIDNKIEASQLVDETEQKQKIVKSSTIIKKETIDIPAVDTQQINDNQQYKRKKMSYNTADLANNSQEKLTIEDANTKQNALLISSIKSFTEKDDIVNIESPQISKVESVKEDTNVDENNEETAVTIKDPVEKKSNKDTAEVVKNPSKENEEQAAQKNIVADNNAESLPDDEIPKSQFNQRKENYDRMAIGAHFGLENIRIDDINIETYNSDISFNYQNMNFIAQTGIGLQISKDKNDYHQNISTSEYQATQVRFDSIVFVPDGNGGMTPMPVDPTYVDVYDTVNHTYESDVTETYYSIRIPLMLGYQKSFKKFGIFGKGGIVYSHIFKNNTGNMNELDNNSVLLSTDYKLAERRSNQLQYVLSIGVSYAISKRMSFNAELMGKYYQYAMYTNSSYESNPWSYEARLGIIYLLN